MCLKPGTQRYRPEAAVLTGAGEPWRPGNQPCWPCVGLDNCNQKGTGREEATDPVG